MKQILHTRKSVIILLICLLNCLNNLWGQERTSLDFQQVEHNESTQTIDLYVRAIEGPDLFSSFDQVTNSFEAWEIFPSGDSLQLNIIFSGRIKDSTRFGEDEIFQVLTQSARNTHREARTYKVNWLRNGQVIASKSLEKRWSDFRAFDLVEGFSFPDLLVLGLFILAFLLFLLSEGVPLFRKVSFRSKYVKPYHQIQRADEAKLHPITGKRLGANEKVVSYCNRDVCAVPLSVWKRKGYQCMHYPKTCNGNANIGTRQFFQQSGIFRQLNWLWFGALGGCLAWIISFGLNRLLLNMDASEAFQNAGIGLALGFGLGFMLSWVEERGQGRSLSWGRILLRSLIGSIIAGLIFFGGHFLAEIIGQNWISTPIVWLVFCLVLGAILSINSTIPLQRGLLSALAAGAISAIIYGISLLTLDSAETVRLLTYIVLGAVFGWGILQVVSQLQTIELEVLSPSHRSGFSYAVDKWLQAGEKIIIGRDMKQCKVRVKWDDDFVLPHHAELDMRNNKVYIKPLEDAELWVNDRPIERNSSLALSGGERIRLGRHSQTSFKYLQKT